MKIKGLAELQKKMDTIQRAMAELDGTLGSVSFDPFDPESIEHAIREMESAVDARIAGFESDSTVASLVEASKEQFRSSILERAAQARLEDSDE